MGLNVRDPKLHDIYRVNLKTGAVELDTQNPGDVSGWSADSDLHIRAAQVVTPDGGTLIRVRDNPKAPWREFQKWGADDTGGVMGFSADNKSLRLLSSVGANTARLLEMEIATGKSKLIAEDPQYDVGGVMVHPKTKKIEAVQYFQIGRAHV